MRSRTREVGRARASMVRRVSRLVVVGVFVTGVVVAFAAPADGTTDAGDAFDPGVSTERPAVPDGPVPVEGLVYARPFVLERGFEFRWSAERPIVDRGWLIVVDVDPDLEFPRETAEPVLYVGDRVAQRVTRGWPTGRLIAIVPGEIDLASAPMWYGSPELPERVSTEIARAELAAAVDASIGPFSERAIARATADGGERFRGADVSALAGVVAELAARFVEPGRPDSMRRNGPRVAIDGGP